jgi:hypothetical protein
LPETGARVSGATGTGVVFRRELAGGRDSDCDAGGDWLRLVMGG